MATSTATEVASRHDDTQRPASAPGRPASLTSRKVGSSAGEYITRKEDDDGIELQPLPPPALARTSSSGNSSTTTSAHESTGTREHGGQPGRARSIASRHSSTEDMPKNALQRFWRDHVSLRVEHASCRDHLALERTYLGYFRTSTLLATTGVFITQLYVLREPTEPVVGSATGMAVGRPLATTCFSLALGTILWGTCRFWRFQRALVRGKALAGGFELTMVLGVSVLLLVTMFVITIVSKG
ncbi:uncharacterized protein B0I36DRAFT_327265 [Microdochium trichocladiopsis]|uniref:DUF202 domain-containing protein n=1 Tax=Microdochium trichocladiopsis TaxID=1682393 RepID=A0A9P9BKY6_9PEZI|nr:uncharacterized protein B0I36DRAFT_327265 [Microdochium trichocladiopsis]KAH7027517.1 hypothetical protein B0I36DRAFT_327265 [Microdochium trichocladiopsis]